MIKLGGEASGGPYCAIAAASINIQNAFHNVVANFHYSVEAFVYDQFSAYGD
jgi:hypothetical protein